MDGRSGNVGMNQRLRSRQLNIKVRLQFVTVRGRRRYFTNITLTYDFMHTLSTMREELHCGQVTVRSCTLYDSLSLDMAALKVLNVTSN